MSEEGKSFYVNRKCMHPRVQEVLQLRNPPSPVVVPRDNSQPRAGYLMSIHKEQILYVPCPQKTQKDKPEVTLSLESCLLRRRKLG
ncbi:hypothetical protein SteCoe_5223 [Stentor coeruleus]|uniref:Uncharacterized protein n=1 Tax=Stentor coeruleus TaxID=5963 RepID=A0A1R2CSY0_9CILI|nr:hypothetical protein SteCoe_5223 [Stentor coeruleus]